MRGRSIAKVELDKFRRMHPSADRFMIEPLLCVNEDASLLDATRIDSELNYGNDSFNAPRSG